MEFCLCGNDVLSSVSDIDSLTVRLLDSVFSPENFCFMSLYMPTDCNWEDFSFDFDSNDYHYEIRGKYGINTYCGDLGALEISVSPRGNEGVDLRDAYLGIMHLFL